MVDIVLDKRKQNKKVNVDSIVPDALHPTDLKNVNTPLNSLHTEETMINLHSDLAEKLTNPVGLTMSSHFRFHLKEHIVYNPLIEDLFANVDSSEIPFSWYTINDRNNHIKVIENNSTLTNQSINEFQLETGNYTIDDVIHGITDELTLRSSIGVVYGYSYNAFKNRVSINITSLNHIATYDTTSEFSICRVIGFSPGLHNMWSGSYLVGDNVTQLYENNSIFISTSLHTNNMISPVNGTRTNILCKIPVNAKPNEKILYENGSTFTCRIRDEAIDYIEVRLVDKLNRLMDLNGASWSCSIMISKIKRKS